MAKTKRSTSIGGNAFWPLSTENRKAFRQAAIETDGTLETLVGLTLLHTGLRNSEFHHMRAGWLEEDPDGEPRIVVPYEEVCLGGSGESGEGNKEGKNLHQRGNPCFRCRDSTSGWVGTFKNAEEGKDFHEPHKWFPKTRGSAGRTIPLEKLDSSGKTAELLDWWFEGHEQIPLAHRAVNKKIERIVSRAGIEREVTAHDLRNTFATHLARNQVDRRQVAHLMGHSLTASTDPYYKFVGADLKKELEDKLG